VEQLVPEIKPAAAPAATPTGIPLVPAVLLAAGVLACAIYANLALAVKHKADYRFFPPFKRYVNANDNGHLGGEYFNMARSLVAGAGFAHPFDRPTGPTAWQPPVLPLILAGLLWACDGNRDAVMAVVVFLQVLILIGTGLLVLALARATTGRIALGVAAAVYFAALLFDFRLSFQTTHDYWLVLLAMDLLIAGLCWLRPLERWPTAAGWGVFGGLCTLINPIVGFSWGTLSLLTGLRGRVWPRLVLAATVAVLSLMPWAIRNYLVFGRFIPVKSNLAYELYQSQCLQPDGLIQGPTFVLHPYGANTHERRQYVALGEIAYLDLKWEQFRQAVTADPGDFIERVGRRFRGAVLWYEPFDRPDAARRPWVLWLSRLAHPLPFLGLLVLVCSSARERLHRYQWIVIGAYLSYLLPYIGISYYERYAMPLLAIKALLVILGIDRLLVQCQKHPAEA
jgi:hypothetical protein